MEYEYKVITWDIYMDISLQDLINKYAREGWELVDTNGKDFVRVTFRKKIESEE